MLASSVGLFVALALTGVAQVVSIHDWCARLPDADDPRIVLGARPVVTCGAGELSITPTVAVVGFASIGAIAAGAGVVGVARRLREQRRST